MLRSFRFRLLVGSVLWTIGLLFFAHYTTVFVAGHISAVRWSRTHEPDYVRALAVAALACMAAGLWQVRKGLKTFDELRARLSDVREGNAQRLEGNYPAEVQPLVHDLNDLLAHREELVRRALAKAGDLAHGLKTPLAVLAHEAERADAAGQHETAAAIRQHVERMHRQVDYHLAHARAAASGATIGTRCLVSESAEGLARTLRRLHAERGLDIRIDVAPDHAVRAQREDLDEILGNLLDNACKWARSRVTLTSSEENGVLVMLVEDDGPGIAKELRETVFQRGMRADEAAPGSGLGLAIARELVELYGGTIALEDAPTGGLRARVELPRA